MRCGASLDVDQAGRKTSEKTSDPCPLKLAVHDHPARGIDAVHLEQRVERSRPSVIICSAWRLLCLCVHREPHRGTSMPFSGDVHPVNFSQKQIIR